MGPLSNSSPARRLLGLSAGLGAALALLSGASGTKAEDAHKLVATVGPGFTITLTTPDGTAVSHLQPGAYTIEVDDRSDIHDFELRGPGVAKNTSQVFVGHDSWEVTFEDGYYRYFCSPHEGSGMRGQFTVGSPPPPSLDAVVDGSMIALTHHDGGAPVTALEPGRYSISVDDRSGTENFRISGPGPEEHSQLQVVGKTVWTVTLEAGTYFYFSDHSPGRLQGRFVVGAPPPRPAEPRLHAIVGPDVAITLVNADASPVAAIDQGTYTIDVDDLSQDHEFHLVGPGVNRATGTPFVGRETWTVTLRPGTYTFVCDPHHEVMFARFTVTGEQPAGPAAAPRARIKAAVKPRGSVRLRPRSVKPGRYLVTVNDRSRKGNFHLKGHGLNRKTRVRFVGMARWKVRLRAGTYRYGNDRRRLSGRLRVR